VHSVRPTAAPFDRADEISTFGVTGTNGKTSTVHLLASVIAAAGHEALEFGTVGTFVDGVRQDLSPSAKGFVDGFMRLHEAGGRGAVVECTSLTLDHQSTHGSMEHYLASKAQLFTQLGPGRSAVLNAADPSSLVLDTVIPSDVQRRWYGSPTRGPLVHEAELRVSEVEVDPSGTEIMLAPSADAEALGGSLRVRMVGEVFAENALAAAAAGLAAGLPGDRVALGLARSSPVPGRFEVLSRSPVVVVDYAHSPDALARTCDAARSLSRGRLLVVFGAGGDSSAGKRTPMGEAVGRRADLAIVTNDNPRDEDPEAIAEMLLVGLRDEGRASIEVQLDRRLAIESAVSQARAEDIVVVAGKGHELGQMIGGETRPFSDRDEVRRVTGGDRP